MIINKSLKKYLCFLSALFLIFVSCGRTAKKDKKASLALNKEKKYSQESEIKSTIINEIQLHGKIYDLVQYGNYVFVACEYRNNILMVFDISNIQDPKLVYTYKGSRNGNKLRIFSGYLFLLAGGPEGPGDDLLIFNISNPAAPKFISKIDNSFFAEKNKESYSYIYDIYFDNNIAYVLTDSAFLCVDLKSKEKPGMISRSVNNGADQFISLKKGQLSAVGISTRINFINFNVENPKKPKIDLFLDVLKIDTVLKNIGTYSKGSPEFHSRYFNNMLLINASFRHNEGLCGNTPGKWTGENDLLIVYDLRDPKKPKSSGTFQLSGECEFITSAGDHIITLSKKLKADYFKVSPGKRSITKLTEKEKKGLSLTKNRILLRKNYLKNDQGITYYDFSDPKAVKADNIFFISGEIKQIEIHDNIAFVADNEQGLILIDISNPIKLSIINEFKTKFKITGFCIAQNTLFLAEEGYGIRILNIENKKNFIEARKIEIKGRILEIIAAGDQIAVLTRRELKLFKPGKNQIYKNTNNIKLEGRISCMENIKEKIFIPVFDEKADELYLSEYDIQNKKVSGKNFILKKYKARDTSRPEKIVDFCIDIKRKRGFITTNKSIEVIDLTSTPKIINRITPEGTYVNIASVKYENDKIYISLRDHMQIFQEEKNSFKQILRYKPEGMTRTPISAFDVKNDTIYIGEAYSGIYTVKPNYGKDPLYVTTIKDKAPFEGEAITVKDNYLIGFADGLNIFDINGNFKLISKIDGIEGRYLFRDRNILYIADWFGVKIVNMENIKSPKIISEYKYKPEFRSKYEAGWPSGIFVENNYLYMTVGERSLGGKGAFYCRVLNVSDPAKPIFAGEYKTNGNLVDVQVQNNIAYLVENGHKNGLEIVDWSDKKNPVLIGEYGKNNKGEPNAGNKIILNKDLAYLAFSKSIHILNIKKPSKPELIKVIMLDFYFEDMALYGNYLYVAATGAGFMVINIEDAANPYIIKKHETFMYPNKICVDDKYIFVSDSGLGIMVFYKNNQKY